MFDINITIQSNYIKEKVYRDKKKSKKKPSEFFLGDKWA